MQTYSVEIFALLISVGAFLWTLFAVVAENAQEWVAGTDVTADNVVGLYIVSALSLCAEWC